MATSLVVGASMAGAVQAAPIDLSTGSGHATWTVSYPGDGGVHTTVDVPNGTFPIPPWLANDSASTWITPIAFEGKTTATPGIDYVYTTTFDLSNVNSMLSGRWLSDNETVSVTLNGHLLTPSTNGSTSFTAWTDLNSVSDPSYFQATGNQLVFTVHNQDGLTTGNPTGFRFEGNVQVGVVPEPSSLVLSAIGTLLVGRLSWKRRMARRAA